MSDVSKTIELDEEIEGDQIGSRDYRFSSIGEPVPIKPEPEFHPDSPPAQPLAVSETFRLLFVAHSHGFCVARTKEVMAAAEEIKAKGSSRSIQELSILDLSIGKVSILALSADDSMLAASVAHQLYFFAVSSLLHKEQEPSFSVSIDDASSIIDMRWTKRAEKAYVVLSSDGKLYQGSGQGTLREVMDNVEAVEWSVKGDSVAVARKNVLSVYSPQFKEKLSLLLSFKSVIGDSEDNSIVKVNSIRWARSDCIVIGCFQSNGDAEEENYIVQVITSKEGKITDASSKPIVISFNDVFLDYRGDALPFASGPHLFLSYLDHQQLAFVVNRKNQSQHVILLGWGQNDKKNEAAAIEIASDAWNAHIESQANGDDNLVLGLSIDKVPQNEQVRLVLGEKETEVSPCCVLLCLTIDGKLSLFHFASAREPSVLPEVSDVSHEEEDAPHIVPSESSEISSRVGEESGKQALQKSESHKLSRNQVFNREEVNCMSKSQVTTENLEEKSLHYSQTIIGDGQQKFPLPKLLEDRNIQQTSYNGQKMANSEHSSLQTSRFLDSEPAGQDFLKKDNAAISETKSSTGFSSFKDSGQATNKNMLTSHSTEFSGTMATTGSKGTPPLSWSIIAANSSKISGLPQDVNSSKPSSEASMLFPSGAVLKSEISSRSAFNFSGGPHQYPSYSKGAVSPSQSVPGERVPKVTGNIQPPATFHGSKSTLLENLSSGRSFKSHPKMESYAATSSEGIEEMAKQLDYLLEGIEGKGGFIDASIASQESLVVEMEEGIRALCQRCRMWEGTMDERLRDIQQLLDKTVQVLARKMYMEGIFKQASDSQYWGLWNRQKLCPELELKRCHIVELNQELTNQLIKLERHFNSLELSRFGENGGLQENRRTPQSSQGQSRNVRSLHSLHNTMNAQLAAAEQLSDCLLKQMSLLNIDSPMKKQNIKKELFDTIGLSYDGSSYSSPGKEKVPATPSDKELLTSSYSLASNEKSRRIQISLARSCEPETARRRRDSLDRTWVSFDPPKTTVKRMLLQDDHEKVGATRSFTLDKQDVPPLQKEMEVASSAVSTTSSISLLQSKGKGLPDKAAKQSTKSSSNALFQWTDSVPDPPMHSTTKSFISSSQLALLPTSSAGQNSARRTDELTDEISKGNKSLIGKTDSASVAESKSVQHSLMPTHQASSNFMRLHLQTPPAPSSIQGSESNEQSVFTKSAFMDTKHTPKISESLRFSFNESSMAAYISGTDVESSTRESKSDKSPLLQVTSSSSSPTTTDFSSALPSSALSRPSETTLFSGMSSSSKASGDANQKVPESQTSLPSATLSFTFSFSIPKRNGPSSFPPSTSASSETLKTVSMTSDVSESKQEGVLTSQTSDLSVSKKTVSQSSDVADPKRDQISTAPTSFASFSSRMDNVSATASLVQQAANSKSDIGRSSDGAYSAQVIASNAKPAQPHTAEVPSSSLNSGTINNAQNVISNEATHEEEMEEEAPEISQATEISLGHLGGFGIGSAPTPNQSKPNPFGVPMVSGTATPTNSSFTMPAPGGELFRPASFGFQSLQPSQQPTGFGAFSGGLSTGNTGQAPAVSGFGQPAQIGSGQKALGSVLGAFGQSRQIGTGLAGSGIASGSGFVSGFYTHTSGGFGGGFSGVAPTSGGFGSLASVGGGFSTAAGAGGFAAAATAAGGFAAAATAGGGFAAAAATAGPTFSGFGALGNQQGIGAGFSAFGSGSPLKSSHRRK